jgi:thymidine kinase
VKCAEENRLREAAFTYRILPAISNEQIDVGGEEKYIAVCRTHYNKLID